MKKFLTVLLALSVVFTYSFGTVSTAFAGTDHTVTAAELNAGYTAASNALTAKDATIYTSKVNADGSTKYSEVEGLYWYDSTDKEYVLANQVADPRDGVEYFEKTSYAVPLDAWKEALKKAYNDKMDAVVAKTYETSASGIDYVTLEVRDDLLALTYDEDSKYAGYAVATQFDAEILKIAETMAKCDTSIYSTTTYTDAKIAATPLSGYAWTVDSTAYNTALDVANAQVAKDVKDFKTTYLEKYKTVVAGTLSSTLGAIMASYKAASENLTDGVYELKGDILTKVKEASLNASDKADIASGLAILEKDIASYLNDQDLEKYSSYTSKTSTTKADVDEAIAAFRTAQTWLNENVAVYTTGELTYDAMKLFITPVVNVAKWTAKAAELKGKKNDDGSAMYDADTVDDALFDAISAEYGASHNGSFASDKITYLTNVEKAYYKSVVVIDDDADNYTVVTVGAIGTSTTTSAVFYNFEYTQVKAAIDVFNSAVDAANTVADVEKAHKALKTTIGKIDTKSTVEAYYTGTDKGSVKTVFVAERDTLINYYKYFVTLDTKVTYEPVFTDVTSAAIVGGTDVTVSDDTLAQWYILKNARTEAEVKALAAEAKAAVAAAKTTVQLKAEAEAVVALIAALPKTVTLADKAAVVAAYDAYDDLSDTYKNYVSNIDTLKADSKAVQVLEYAAVEAAEKLLPTTTAKATVADKANALAAYDAAKAYNDTDLYSVTDFSVSKNYTTTSIVKVMKAIQALELTAVEDAVENLPSPGKVTVDSKATVEAARTAYDAYVSEYLTNYDSDKHTAYDVTTLKKYEAKIVAAEEELAGVLADVNPFEGLDLKASTKKVGKKIKVTLKGVAIDDSTAYVQLWKSKNAVKWSFSKRVAVTTTSTYITKPYKGKTYVKFRVVTVNEDGTKNFSAWSNLGCRIVK